MKTSESKLTGIRAAVALTVAVWASAGMAAAPLDTSKLDPSVSAASCDAVNWNRDLEAQYPWIRAGCKEVIMVNGAKWARFDADFIRQNPNGSVVFDFKDRNDASMGRVALDPARNQRVTIDGQKYKFSDLSRGQKLNLYVPEGMYAIAMSPGAPAEELERIVPPSTEVAQMDTAPTPMADRLPHTAGPLPLVLLAGLMSLFAGLGMTIRRRFSR